MSIICDFMLRVICAAGLYAYAYHRGQQAGCACATAPETETADTQWRAECICTAGVDVVATGYSLEVCLWRRTPERREVRRGKKFSSFFRKFE